MESIEEDNLGVSYSFTRRSSNFCEEQLGRYRRRWSLFGDDKGRYKKRSNSLLPTSSPSVKETLQLSSLLPVLEESIFRTPTVADLQNVNRNIGTSVSTLAEFNKFYTHTDIKASIERQQKEQDKVLTGLEKRRPSDCVIVTNDIRLTERVRINISGRIFETYRFVLNRFPDGLLGDEAKRQAYWDDERKEYFFDHSAECFEGIMQYYQSGILRPPKHTHLDTFIEALEFFQFSKETILKVKRREAVLVEEDIPLPENKFQRNLWLLFEHPHSSRLAHALALFSVLVIFVSLGSFVLETLPEYADTECVKSERKINGKLVTELKPVYLNIFFIVESLCASWFILEILFRFFACPSKRLFILSFMNIVDIVSVLPFVGTLLYTLITGECLTSNAGILLVLRALRVFRVFKLTRFSKGLKILTTTLKESKYELLLVVFIVVLASFIFGITLYIVEEQHPERQIRSLYDGYWWAVITITTVGYGDVIPVSFWGKLVSSACIVMGTVVIALPTPIIVTNFNRYYRNETGRGFADSEWLKSFGNRDTD